MTANALIDYNEKLDKCYKFENRLVSENFEANFYCDFVKSTKDIISLTSEYFTVVVATIGTRFLLD